MLYDASMMRAYFYSTSLLLASYFLTISLLMKMPSAIAEKPNDLYYQLLICKETVAQELVLKLSILFQNELSKEGTTILELIRISPEHRLVVSYRGSAFKQENESYFFFWRGSPDFTLKLQPPHARFYVSENETITEYSTQQGTWDDRSLQCQGHKANDFSLKDFEQLNWVESTEIFPIIPRNELSNSL